MITRWCNISTLNVFKNLLSIDGHGERFFARRRNKGIISRATGVVWIILILVQNDREKKQKTKNKNKNKKNIADGPCPCDARAWPKIDVP